MTDIGANDLQILTSDSPQEAPTYRKPEYLFANLKTAHVVGRGTAMGLPTVDFIFVDEQGQKYCAMLTAGLVENLVAVIEGVKRRTMT